MEKSLTLLLAGIGGWLLVDGFIIGALFAFASAAYEGWLFN